MRAVMKITPDLAYVGASDRRLARFENAYPIPRGMSYHAYLLLDEKTVLFDTVDHAVADVLMDKLSAALDGRALDYVVVNHVEPDHAASLVAVLARYPSARLVTNAKAASMLRQFFPDEAFSDAQIVGEGDRLVTGRHALKFFMAPMVHWPESMVTYDEADKTLFSADAFGAFGAPEGHLFADQVDYEHQYMSEARRYYANIVGKYGPQVQALLKKVASLDVAMVCPLHGHVWRKDIGTFVRKYQQWSTYEPEERAVVIAYGSPYGHTERAAEALAQALSARGVERIALYDVSDTHVSYLVAEAFRASHLVLASATYNAGLYPAMAALLDALKAHNLQNRTFALIENGSWAPASGKIMAAAIEAMPRTQILEPRVSIRSAINDDQEAQLMALADAIAASVQDEAAAPEAPVEPKAFFTLSYGLFVLTAQENARDNGCIINTVTQATDNPKRVTIIVNKQNLTHDMIVNTGRFAVTVLDASAPFSLFQRFGYQSGRTVDKFEGLDHVARAANGLAYLAEHASAMLTGRVIRQMDCGTHTVFVADVTEAQVLSGAEPLTYAYYFKHIKPAPKLSEAERGKVGFVCSVCGYIYEGATLPPDYICPICKHGAEVFTPLA